MTLSLILGSTSNLKLLAVKRVCASLGHSAIVSGIETDSGQNAQPFGLDETVSGALQRARAAHIFNPKCIAVGIENGIFCVALPHSITFDIAIIAVITPVGRKIITTSPGIIFPEAYVEIARERGFETTTVGSVIADQLGGDPADPHSTVTKGAQPRIDLLEKGIIAALLQL